MTEWRRDRSRKSSSHFRPFVISPPSFSFPSHLTTPRTLFFSVFMTAKTSSASSGTRKKNAAKKAGKNKQLNEGDDQEDPSSSRPSGGSHLTKKDKQAQKIKRGQPKPYTPPPKPPAPAVPDPLDALGLGTTLPAELVVVLRKLGKKDEITRRRALEDFASWLVKVQKAKPKAERKEGAEGGGKEESELVEEEVEDENADGWWVEMIGPVWVSAGISFLGLYLLVC